jgi:PadR family transcriptional regulator, regulatory protein AphA
MKQTDYVILGLLTESPLTGYQMKKIIDIRFRFFWNESYGQLYPTLKALSEDGYIAEVLTGEKQKRAQRTYRITSGGLAALQHWLPLPVEKESVRLEILLKMYFSNLSDKEVMMRHISVFQQSHEQDLKVLGMFEKELKSVPDKDLNHAYVLRVIDFGRKVNEAYLDWCRETMRFLEGREEE